ncbi:MAG: sigma-70 family RNA polymerase sigma factor [Marinoscillum sp.]
MHSAGFDYSGKEERSGDNSSSKPVDIIVNDGITWDKFKKGDKAALTFIYRNYSNLLFNYGCQFTTNRELVKDAIQDLFIEIINNKENLSQTDSIKFYLFRALRNKLIRMLAKKNSVDLETLENNHPFEISISPETIIINRQIDEEKRTWIAEKLNELPPLQKEALLLFYFEGLTYAQISNMLGMKVKSARALVYRAIKSISKLMNAKRDVFN